MADCSCQEVAWLPLVGVALGGTLAIVAIWLFTQQQPIVAAAPQGFMVTRDASGRVVDVRAG